MQSNAESTESLRLIEEPVSLPNLRRLSIRFGHDLGGVHAATLLENLDFPLTPTFCFFIEVGSPDGPREQPFNLRNSVLLGEALKILGILFSRQKVGRIFGNAPLGKWSKELGGDKL